MSVIHISDLIDGLWCPPTGTRNPAHLSGFCSLRGWWGVLMKGRVLIGDFNCHVGERNRDKGDVIHVFEIRGFDVGDRR